MQFRIFSRKNYIVRFEMFGRIFLSKLFRDQKIVSGSKIKKKKQKNDVLEIALDQWNERVRPWLANDICLFAFYVASSRITTVHTFEKLHSFQNSQQFFDGLELKVYGISRHQKLITVNNIFDEHFLRRFEILNHHALIILKLGSEGFAEWLEFDPPSQPIFRN